MVLKYRGVLSIMNFGVEQVMGLAGLLVLIPFIIVYLIKPRPQKLAVPSLMFFMKKQKISVKDSLFRIFQKDYLFFIQLLILLLLALSLAYPYLAKEEDVVSKNIVFVLDASGSMNVIENSLGGKTRFELAKEEIAKLATDSNTLILVKSYPSVQIKNAPKSAFLAFLNRLNPTEGESRIGDSILMAGEVFAGEKGRVVVASDFINTKGVSVKTAKDILAGKGISTDLINVGLNNHNNFGIVNVISDEVSTSAYFKNYGTADVTLDLDIDGQAQKLNVKAGDTESFIYKTKEGVSTIKIINQDDFMQDNLVNIVNPAGQKINVLLITNTRLKFLEAALKSSPRINLKVAEPPVIPDEKIDVYVIGKIDFSKLLPGTFENILSKVEKGANVIITSQIGINQMDFKGLSNVKFESSDVVPADLVTLNSITKFTKDIDFGLLKNAYAVSEVNGEVLAESNKIPVLVYSELKGETSGKILYYGILESQSSFHLSPDYPVFWSSLVKTLVGAREMNELNLKSGMSFIDNKNNEIVVDNAGLYNISSNEISVNMLNDLESNINYDSESQVGDKITNYKFKTIKEEVRSNLLDIMLVAGLILLLFEIIYIKHRGEI